MDNKYIDFLRGHQKGYDMRKIAIAVSALLLMFFMICSVQAADPLVSFAHLKGTIEIAGGTAHIPVMKDAARAIMTYNPNIRINIAGGGSGVGVQKVGEGLVDIGNTGRALSEAEISRYGLKSYPFAMDGVAVIVHPSNPVTQLSAEQVRQIFSGQISKWDAVKGTSDDIHLFTRDEASGTREVFWKKVLNKGSIATRADVVPSNGAMKTAVAQDKDAIGYMSIGYVDDSVKTVVLDGVPATQENALSGKYPVARKLYMNTKGDPTPLVKAFIAYIQSPAAEPMIRKHGFDPIK